MKRNLFISCCFFLARISSISQTIITDRMHVSGSWSLSGSPYIIQGRAIVPAGQTLVISPGVQVKFTSNTAVSNSNIWVPDSGKVGSLHVLGKIVANGTAVDTISFSANGAGFWGGLIIPSGADTTSSLKYCKFSEMFQLVGGDSILGGSYVFCYGLFTNLKSITLAHLLFQNNKMATSLRYTNIMTFSEFRNSGVAQLYRVDNSIFDNTMIQSGGLVAVNCIIRNSPTAFYMSTMTTGNFKIINSTIFNNQIVYLDDGGGLFEAYNTIFMNNVVYDSTQTPSFPIHELLHNCVFAQNNSFNNISSSSSVLANTNPNLINPISSHGDFHLLSSSICINSGDTAGVSKYIPAIDLDGNPRYVSTIDIGPYEYNSISVQTFLRQNSINVFPNPVTSFVTLKSENELNEIFVYNTLGEVIWQEKANKNSAQIDLSQRPPGIYFVSVQNQFIKLIKE